MRRLDIALVVAVVFAAAAVGRASQTTPSAVHPSARTTGAAPLVPDLFAACESGNPCFAVTRFFNWPAGDDRPALVEVRDSLPDEPWSNLAAQPVLATHAEVGVLYGLAYDWRRHQLYAAAYHKRGLMYGPGGPGAVYRADLDTGETLLWANLDAGPDRHDFAKDYDLAAAPWSGKTSLGDIEISDAGSELFVVNLYDRKIHRLAVPSGRQTGVIEHGAIAEPWARDARPFGLGYHDGWLYHGVVNSMENDSLRGPLSGHIYRSRSDGGEMTEVARFDMYYRVDPPWLPWNDAIIDPWPEYYGQPLIGDIEFRPNGDLIVGLKDRSGGMLSYSSDGHGDVLPTTRGPGPTWDVRTEVEVYDDDFDHDESCIGALARFPGRDTVVAPVSGYKDAAAALIWYDNSSGSVRGPNGGSEWVSIDDSVTGDIESLSDPQGLAHLPQLSAGTCLRRRPVDVALILDMSTSMRGLAADGQTKYEAAIAAAEELVRYLRMGPGQATPDRVAIVGFNDAAWTELDLTADRVSVTKALDRLLERIQEGTRLDLALERAFEAVVPSRGDAVLILLTDGVPNRVPPGADGRPETTVLAMADALKAAPARVFTVGFGEAGDVNERLLRGVASQPSMYYYAPNADELLRIYQQIAEAIDCPAEVSWLRR